MKWIVAAVFGIGLVAAWSRGGSPAAAALEPCSRQEEIKYQGSKSCQKCHFQEYGAWQKTKMAQAFKALKPKEALEAKKKANLDPEKDYSKDAKCVACHVTGYGKPGGYPAIVEGKEWTDKEKERAPLMENVGCESCHGPGEKASAFKKDNKEYKWADIAKMGVVHPDEKTCASCHNKDSPTFKEFDFKEKIGTDTHTIFKLKKDHACDHPHREGK